MGTAMGYGAGGHRADTELDLPPGFRGVPLREYKTALTHAAGLAASEGAGTLVFVRRFDRVEFAVVLEPEEPLGSARRAVYAVQNAAADALTAHLPPEKLVTFDWPDTVRIDGGIVGGLTFAAPDDARADAVPDWIVVGVELRAVVPLRGAGANQHDVHAVAGTGLDIEGVELIDGNPLIESFARHLMLQFDHWRSAGFAAVERAYLERLGEARARRRAISVTGDLVERGLVGDEVIARHDLAAALAVPRWRDPATGEPWL